VLLAVTQALVPTGELVESSSQVLLVGDETAAVALGGAVLSGRGTGPSL
jgi:hypothetical protein